MKFTLLNKNTPVLDFKYNQRRGGFIESVLKVHNPEYAPLSVADKQNKIDLDNLCDWWEERSIPDSRKNVENILELINCDKQELIINSLALSLSDQYWIKPIGSDIKWQDVNFFTNDFSEEIGKMFFREKPVQSDSFRNYSPDYTLNGFLNKRWLLRKGKRILLKGGHGAFKQQPYNEQLAADILAKIGCTNFVPYTVEQENNQPVSLCENFITENTEYVPANLIRRVNGGAAENYYQQFINSCTSLGVGEAMQASLDYILQFDYLIANIDRNFGNFGIIRNVETLKIEKIAPIFDNGNSLWYDDELIEQDIAAYPFALKQSEQIKLVNNYQVFPHEKFNQHITVILAGLKNNKRLANERVEKIIKAVQQRCVMLERLL